MSGTAYQSGILQVKAYKILQAHVAAEVKRYDLNPTQWFIVGQIKENKHIRTADLADLLKVDPPLITYLTDDLVYKGLIKKSVHQKDKRVKLLLLTPKGSKMVKELDDRLQAVLKTLLDGTTAQELKSYEKVLQIIVSNGQEP